MHPRASHTAPKSPRSQACLTGTEVNVLGGAPWPVAGPMGDGGSVPQLPPPLGETLPGVVQGLPEVQGDGAPVAHSGVFVENETSFSLLLPTRLHPLPPVLIGRGVLLEQPDLDGQERHASLKQDPEVCL